MPEMNLQPIEFNNQRVLTFKQIAELFETDVNTLSSNFKRHKDQYVEGKHYYRIEGKDLQQFKDGSTSGALVGSNASSLLLWTERGVLYHAKLLGSQRAWEVYEELVETYFLPKTLVQQKLPSRKELAQMVIDQEVELEKLTNQLAITQPKADAFDEFVNSPNYHAGIIVAKMFFKHFGLGNGGIQKFYEILRNEKILFREPKSHANVPYQSFMGQHPGFLKINMEKLRNGQHVPCTMFHGKFVEWYIHTHKLVRITQP